MGTYNWVNLEGACPACGIEARIRVQTHIASYGRFHDRSYGLDARMAWWPQGDRRFDGWTERADPGHLPAIREACYSECQSCKAELCVVLEFQDLRPTRVLRISLESDWPDGYFR